MDVEKNARLSSKPEGIDKILESFEILNEIDVKSIEPSFQPFEIKNILRDDVTEGSLSQEEALKNAEQKQDKFFKGPRAV